MAKITTTYTARMKIPATASFYCRRCGRQVSAVNLCAYITGSASGRGYQNQAAQMQSQRNLMATAGAQLSLLEDCLKRGRLDVLSDTSGKRDNIQCPSCGMRQFIYNAENKKVLYPRLFALRLAAALYLPAGITGIIAGIIIGMAGQDMSALPSAGGILTALLLAVGILSVIAVLFRNRRLFRKALTDPHLMEKRYRRVLAERMDIALMAGTGDFRMITIQSSAVF
ncbi:MAG: hypothetical protein IJP92_11120 [Lachnospiraceae bacterium]|nr:hypothetical protein [Lachnospiraceae bacterium]